jgi:transposase
VTVLAGRLVPDPLWEMITPLIPPAAIRPQGGGRSRVDDRPVLVAIVFIVTSGTAWGKLPRSFGVAVPTAYRRFREWTAADVWTGLRAHVTDTDDHSDTKRSTDTGHQWAYDVATAAMTRASTYPP